MTDKDRKEARYQRRKKQRTDKRIELSNKYAVPEEVFSTHAIVDGFKKSKKASSWKASTQAFGSNLFINAAHESDLLLRRKWKPKGFFEFNIIERGKPRNILSVHISEKCVQSTLSNNCLIPILSKSLIHNNGASLSRKGTDFSLREFEKDLKHHYNLYGLTGGIYFFDFSGYFKHINHQKLKHNVSLRIFNEQILDVYNMLVDAFNRNNEQNPEGLGLGSQVSQISAIFFPNSIDHWAKDEEGIDGYGHYMDDGYIMSDNIEFLKYISEEFERRCLQIGILLNKKKCRIIKMDKYFNYLKVRFFITESGKVVKRINQKSVTKERRRLRKLKRLIDNDLKTFDEVNLEFHSWLCSQIRGCSFHVTKNIIRYFNSLFLDYGGYSMPKKEPKRKQRRKYKMIRTAMRQLQFESEGVKSCIS